MARILLKSAWGAEDPTRACFPFLHANAFRELGHEVQVFLLGNAVEVMRDDVIDRLEPVGWAPLRETFPMTIAHRVPIHV